MSMDPDLTRLVAAAQRIGATITVTRRPSDAAFLIDEQNFRHLAQVLRKLPATVNRNHVSSLLHIETMRPAAGRKLSDADGRKLIVALNRLAPARR